MSNSSPRSDLSRFVPYIVLFLAIVVVPVLYSLGVIDIAKVNQCGRYLCFAIVALGVDLVWGYTGILSLCQAMFFVMGAYAMGMHLALHGPTDGPNHDIPRCLFVVSSAVSGFSLPWFWKPFDSLAATLILGWLIPGVAAFIFGYLAFRSRVRGVYFSIITQATTLAAVNVLGLNNMLLCGTNGLTNFETLGPIDLRVNSGKLTMYIITVVVLVVLYLACQFLVKSRLGRILVAIRDNEPRLRFSGYRPLYFKIFAFTAAAAIAGIGGMLYSPQNGIVTPSDLDVEKSIFMVVLVAVGGRSSLSGAILGALVVNFIYSITTSGVTVVIHQINIPLLRPEYWPFVLGLLALSVVLYFPAGLIGLWRRLNGTDDTGGAHN